MAPSSRVDRLHAARAPPSPLASLAGVCVVCALLVQINGPRECHHICSQQHHADATTRSLSSMSSLWDEAVSGVRERKLGQMRWPKIARFWQAITHSGAFSASTAPRHAELRTPLHLMPSCRGQLSLHERQDFFQGAPLQTQKWLSIASSRPSHSRRGRGSAVSIMTSASAVRVRMRGGTLSATLLQQTPPSHFVEFPLQG